MAHFVIIPTDTGGSNALDTAVLAKFDKKCYRLPRGEWLAWYDGTSKQLSDELQISEGTVGVPAIVLNFSGYFGRANKDIWEWLSVTEKS